MWLVRVAAGLGYCCCSAAWVKHFVLPLSPGWSRGLAVLPLVVCNCLSPKAFDVQTEIVSVGICAFLLFWLANFKASSSLILELASCSEDCILLVGLVQLCEEVCMLPEYKGG